MGISYVLDAHTLIWYIEENPRLGLEAKYVLDRPDVELYLPIIALAEACWVIEHKRSRVPSVKDLLRDVDGDPRITIIPLDREILDLSFGFEGIDEMHDRQIVATAVHLKSRGESVALLSKDKTIAESEICPVVW